ncbi:DUF4832 domain-containing protein [Marinicrinis sediminis]|uniref:DUF4832 domain-containing protein n=1 Tax=Marinicrinis sediminis TaxID=1652465 RepID=A0ABW5R804_9BACL
MSKWIRYVRVLLLTGGLAVVAFFTSQIWSESSTKMMTFYPTETDELLINPYKGFSADATDVDWIEFPVSLAHVNIDWKDFEPEEGVYRFDDIEEQAYFEEWKSRNVRFVLRFVLDDPGDTMTSTIPDWLYEKIDQSGTWYEVDYGKGFSPDYAHPELIQAHQKAIAALAARYDEDPSIAFIQIGSIGHWGEWHTARMDNKRIPYPKQPVATQYIQHYLDHFAHDKLMMRRPEPLALKHRLGLFNDAFGNEQETIEEFVSWVNEGYTSWLTDEEMPAMPDYWKHGAGGGEFSTQDAITSYFQKDRFGSVMTQLQLTHASWMGPNSPVTQSLRVEERQRAEQFVNAMGYHFVVRSVQHPEKGSRGEEINVEIEVENKGVAPFYFDWPIELSLANETGKLVFQTELQEDIRSWLPGTHTFEARFKLPEAIPAGEYQLLIAILDPSTAKPGMSLAMEGRQQDGRYGLGKLKLQ